MNTIHRLLRPLLLLSFVCWVVVPSTGVAAQPGRASVARYALVIGSNHTIDPTMQPLRFADDDAARMTELLTELGVHVELVTSLDRESQAVFPALVQRAHRPDREGVLGAYEDLLDAMALEEHGAPIELLIYYSGHGDISRDGQGYLTLEAGKLTRHDLFIELLERSPADHNHIILDACNSEEFVLTRGGGWQPDGAAADQVQRVDRYLEQRQLDQFPNTGVILAQSADQQTHEWERYQGGIFSHEIISGLRGAADINGDGSIEYSELAAFISAANFGVDDPRARLSVFVHPPRDDERHALMTHDLTADQRFLLFLHADGMHYTVEDERGVRLADLHHSGEQCGYLRLPDGVIHIQRKTRDEDGGLRLEETTVAQEVGGLVVAQLLPYAPTQRAARGAMDQSLRAGLFVTPYGPGYYMGYTDQHGMLAVADVHWQQTRWHNLPGYPGADRPAAVRQPHRTAGDDAESRAARRRAVADSSAMWGAVSVATILMPFEPQSEVDPTPDVVKSNQFSQWFGPVRGIDVRWISFTHHGRSRFPDYQIYFRSGLTQGNIEFAPCPSGQYGVGQATDLRYQTVPLFFGADFFPFHRFPVRPFAGLGAGFDVIRLHYSRHQSDDLIDAALRIGFELHAGLEVRLGDRFVITAEVTQQWSHRRKVEILPDFSNEGFTATVGVAMGFPLYRYRTEKGYSPREDTAAELEAAASDMEAAAADMEEAAADMEEAARDMAEAAAESNPEGTLEPGEETPEETDAPLAIPHAVDPADPPTDEDTLDDD